MLKYDLTGLGISGYDDLNEAEKAEVSEVIEDTQKRCDSQKVPPSVRVAAVMDNRDFTIKRIKGSHAQSL
jgi:hypothetical protein